MLKSSKMHMYALSNSHWHCYAQILQSDNQILFQKEKYSPQWVETHFLFYNNGNTYIITTYYKTCVNLCKLINCLFKMFGYFFKVYMCQKLHSYNPIIMLFINTFFKWTMSIAWILLYLVSFCIARITVLCTYTCTIQHHWLIINLKPDSNSLQCTTPLKAMGLI